MDTIEIYKDAAGRYRWHRQAANGDILFDSGQGYSRKIDAMKIIERTQKLPYQLIDMGKPLILGAFALDEDAEQDVPDPESTAAINDLIRMKISEGPPAAPSTEPCSAFSWLANNFQWCGTCYRPYWQHDFIARSWGLEQIPQEMKDATRELWERSMGDG